MADEQPNPTPEEPGVDPSLPPEASQPTAEQAAAPVAPDAAPAQDPGQLASDFKKTELQAAAAVQGVDVPSSATKADIAEAIVAQQPAGAAPVVVNNVTKRSDDDALVGSWVDVVSGPLQGRFGSYVDTVHYNTDTGYPSVILIRSRDARNELLEVAYSDVRPSERTGGR